MSLEQYKTSDYDLRIGEHEGLSIYQVVNREYGVMEYQDYLLPRVLDTLYELQERLDKMRVKLSGGTPEPANDSNVLGFSKPGGKDDDTGGLH